MKKSKPPKNRKEMLRRSKLRKSWTPERRARQSARQRQECATPEGKAKMSAASKKGWTPQRRRRQSVAQRKSWAKPGVRVWRVAGIKNAWTPERREAQSVRTKRMNADSELTARRIASLRKQKSSPENRKRVSAWSNGLWAKREHRERRSSTMKNTWAELRTARAAHAAAKTHKGPGAPKKAERTKRILELRGLHPDWNRGHIAREMYPEFDKLSNKEREHIRDAIRKVEERTELPKKQEVPA